MADSRNAPADRKDPGRTDAVLQAALALAQEVGYAKLSIEGIASRAGVGKHTIYRRWPSKGAVFLDAMEAAVGPALRFPETGDVRADLREQILAGSDFLGKPPFGPLYAALIGEAQRDPAVKQALYERFLLPIEQQTIDRLRTAQEQGQLAPGLDLALAQDVLYGPLYYRCLVTTESVTPAYVDALLDTLFDGFEPS
ncbi:TetR/AcrR family transcriptional regulator [Streptomyces sp. NPDC041068]|uniref:TetR/AcrR family transcriptional regulator n=1 Tax=Streptomyces sp. NPDC041068 TaxID=3155130 RepID=UPI0033C01E1D